MADPVITNVDIGGVQLEDARFGPSETFTAAGAKTFLQGTILARESATKKLIVFVKGGSTNENGIPKFVVNEAFTTTGAGDVQIRPIISGGVRKEKLVIDVDGDGSNVDSDVVDQLKDYSIVARPVSENLILDNQ